MLLLPLHPISMMISTPHSTPRLASTSELDDSHDIEHLDHPSQPHRLQKSLKVCCPKHKWDASSRTNFHGTTCYGDMISLVPTYGTRTWPYMRVRLTFPKEVVWLFAHSTSVESAMKEVPGNSPPSSRLLEDIIMHAYGRYSLQWNVLRSCWMSSLQNNTAK